MNKYEGMFLLDHGKVKNEPEKGMDEIRTILEKHGCRIAQMGKWDERKLAYEIKKQKRGTYILVHFEAPGSAIDEIRRDCTLSEIISRQLIIAMKGDKFPPFMTAQELNDAHGTRDFRDRGSRPSSRPREKRAETAEATPTAGNDSDS